MLKYSGRLDDLDTIHKFFEEIDHCVIYYGNEPEFVVLGFPAWCLACGGVHSSRLRAKDLALLMSRTVTLANINGIIVAAARTTIERSHFCHDTDCTIGSHIAVGRRELNTKAYGRNGHNLTMVEQRSVLPIPSGCTHHLNWAADIFTEPKPCKSLEYQQHRRDTDDSKDIWCRKFTTLS